MEERALYVRDGDAYVGTILTQGGWDPEAANGGAALALLGHCLEDVPTLVPMSISRFTADLVRPVPLGRRLHVAATVLREGKKIQVVQLQLLAGDVEHVRATVLRLREADVSGVDGGPPANTTHELPAAAALAPLEESVGYHDAAPGGPGFLQAVDMRRAARLDGRGWGCWIRLEVPVVAGETLRTSAHLAACFDFANLIGLDGHPPSLTMINPDVTAHALRGPVGEWIAVTGDTRFEPLLGRGVSSAVFSDRDGVFATASTSQLLQPR